MVHELVIAIAMEIPHMEFNVVGQLADIIRHFRREVVFCHPVSLRREERGGEGRLVR